MSLEANMNVQTLAPPVPGKLFVGGRPIDGHPTPADIPGRLQMLYDPQDDFVLMKGHGRYMQCTGDRGESFSVECCEGPGKPVMAAADDLDHSVASELFVSFLNDDDRWRQAMQWVPKAAGKKKKSKFAVKLIEREGGRLIINKHWCLIALGSLFCSGAAISFFMLGGMMDLYLTWIPGSFLAVGVIFLLMSNFVDD